jgi:hypothetical protein
MPHRAAVSCLVFSNGEVQVQQQQQQQQQAEPLSEIQEPLPGNTPSSPTSGEHPHRANEHGAVAADLVVTVETPASSAGSDPGGTVAVDLAAAVSPSSAALHPQFCQGMGVSAVLPRRVMGHAGEASPPRVAWGQEGDECAICLAMMVAGEYVSDLPGLNQTCNHTFHLTCAIQWLTTRVGEGKKGCCPVCNTEVISPIFLVRSQPRAPHHGLTRAPNLWHAYIVCALVLLAATVITYQVVVHTTSTPPDG